MFRLHIVAIIRELLYYITVPLYHIFLCSTTHSCSKHCVPNPWISTRPKTGNI